MSDGNRFVCGMKRFDKHKIQSNSITQTTPATHVIKATHITQTSTSELYKENERKLQELITLRNQQDATK